MEDARSAITDRVVLHDGACRVVQLNARTVVPVDHGAAHVLNQVVTSRAVRRVFKANAGVVILKFTKQIGGIKVELVPILPRIFLLKNKHGG